MRGRGTIGGSVVIKVTIKTKNDSHSLNYQVSRLQQKISSVVTSQYNQDQGNDGNIPPASIMGGRN